MTSSLKHHWVAILVTTLITFSASVVLTLIQPMEYRASFTVLAIDQDPNLDGYAAAKSAERLSQSLAQTILTASFADQVYAQVKDQASLKNNQIVSPDPQTRRDAWKKEITAQAIPDVGQVKVAVYQVDRTAADTLSNAMSIIAAGLGSDYLGGSKYVQLKIVDSPLTTKSPVRPNIFLNLAIGLILGLGGSVAVITLFGAASQTNSYTPMLITAMPPSMLATPGHDSTVTKPEYRQPVARSPLSDNLHVPTDGPQNTVAPEIHHNHQPKNHQTETPSNLPISDEWPMP